MWLASLWSFVFQTAKEAAAAGKRSGTADAQINLRFFQSLVCDCFYRLLFPFCFSFLGLCMFASHALKLLRLNLAD